MTITLALCVVIAALACGSNDPEIDGTTSATAQQGDEGEGSAKGKMLVIYFSRVDENWQVGVVEKGYTQLKADRSMPLTANPLAVRKVFTFKNNKKYIGR